MSKIHKTNNTDRAVFTQNEAADYLRIHRNTLRKLIRSKQIKAVRLGSRILVPRKNIDAFLDNSEFDGGAN